MTTPMTSPTSASRFNAVAKTSDTTLDDLKGAKDNEKLAEWIQSKYKSIKNARGPIERQWYLNLAFYFGKQNVAIVNASTSATGNNFRLHTPQAPPWRVRLVSNKIKPIVRTELAKVTAQKASASVIPASEDDKDIFAARAGEQIWESTYQRKRVKAVMRRAMFWTLLTGTGYIKCWWDAQAPNPDNPQMPGDFGIVHETPFHIFVPDFREEELENQPYLIHASTKSPEWVRQTFGDLADKINPNTSQANDILEDSFIQLVGAQQLQKDSVLCLELWGKPGSVPGFPNGVMATLLGDKIVQVIPYWPYNHNEYPFAKFTHIPTGKFYGDSTVTDLIPLQKEYNRTRSQIIEAKNRMAKPQLIAPRGSIDASKVTTEPGQVIFYTPGFNPPQPLPLTPLPAYVLQELDRIQMDIDDISGQHEITKGRVPPGVSSGTAISFLQEQDDSKLSHTIDSIEDGIEKIARHTLSHVVQYWDVGRVIKSVGDNGAFDAQVLKASDLRSNTDIRVEAGSALPTSKAAKQAFIMDLMKMGFVDPAEGLQVLEIGGISKLYDKLQTDLRQAQRENLRMQNGQPMQPNTWDNHAIHIECHNKFRKSQAFEMLPPEVQAIFEAHVMMHQIVSVGGALTGDPMMGGQSADPNAQPGSDPNANAGPPQLPSGQSGPEQAPNEGNFQ